MVFQLNKYTPRFMMKGEIDTSEDINEYFHFQVGVNVDGVGNAYSCGTSQNLVLAKTKFT